MLRSILAAIAGYIALVIVVFTGIGLAWMILGGGGAFGGEGPYPSSAWLVFSIVSGFLGSVVAGWVALRIGGTATAVKVLLALVVVLGLYSALTAEANYAGREPIDKPVAEMTFMEAGQHAKQPTWYNWVIPLVGAVGVLVGARRREGGVA